MSCTQQRTQGIFVAFDRLIASEHPWPLALAGSTMGACRPSSSTGTIACLRLPGTPFPCTTPPPATTTHWPTTHGLATRLWSRSGVVGSAKDSEPAPMGAAGRGYRGHQAHETHVASHQATEEGRMRRVYITPTRLADHRGHTSLSPSPGARTAHACSVPHPLPSLFALLRARSHKAGRPSRAASCTSSRLGSARSTPLDTLLCRPTAEPGASASAFTESPRAPAEPLLAAGSLAQAPSQVDQGVSAAAAGDGEAGPPMSASAPPSAATPQRHDSAPAGSGTVADLYDDKEVGVLASGWGGGADMNRTWCCGSPAERGGGGRGKGPVMRGKRRKNLECYWLFHSLPTPDRPSPVCASPPLVGAVRRGHEAARRAMGGSRLPSARACSLQAPPRGCAHGTRLRCRHVRGLPWAVTQSHANAVRRMPHDGLSHEFSFCVRWPACRSSERTSSRLPT